LAEIDPILVSWGYWEEDYEDVVIQEAKEAVLDEDGNEIEPAVEQQKERRVKADAVQSPVGVMYDRVTVLLTKELQKKNEEIKELNNKLSNNDKVIELLKQEIIEINEALGFETDKGLL
jgi:predicted RNase H-like nuclease (RuvC/YqgF family)